MGDIKKSIENPKMACNALTSESDSGPLTSFSQGPLARLLPPHSQAGGLSVWGAAELA